MTRTLHTQYDVHGLVVTKMDRTGAVCGVFSGPTAGPAYRMRRIRVTRTFSAFKTALTDGEPPTLQTPSGFCLMDFFEFFPCRVDVSFHLLLPPPTGRFRRRTVRTRAIGERRDVRAAGTGAGGHEHRKRKTIFFQF